MEGEMYYVINLAFLQHVSGLFDWLGLKTTVMIAGKQVLPLFGVLQLGVHNKTGHRGRSVSDYLKVNFLRDQIFCRKILRKQNRA